MLTAEPCSDQFLEDPGRQAPPARAPAGEAVAVLDQAGEGREANTLHGRMITTLKQSGLAELSRSAKAATAQGVRDRVGPSGPRLRRNLNRVTPMSTPMPHGARADY